MTWSKDRINDSCFTQVTDIICNISVQEGGVLNKEHLRSEAKVNSVEADVLRKFKGAEIVDAVQLLGFFPSSAITCIIVNTECSSSA